MREIVNGIFYVMRSGCPWRLVPSDLPPWRTISSETARIGMHGANIAIVCSVRVTKLKWIRFLRATALLSVRPAINQAIVSR